MPSDIDSAMKELRDANPVRDEELTDWAESERGRRMVAEIMASSRVDEEQHASRPGRSPGRAGLRCGRRLSITVGALWAVAVLALAVVGGLSFWLAQSQRTGETPVVSVAVSRSQVTREEALEELVPLTWTVRPEVEQYPQLFETGEEAGLIREAVQLGLLRPEEGPDFQLARPVTRQDYILWLWRGFSTVLERAPTPEGGRSPSDADMLTSETRAAVEGLARVGVVVGFTDGSFSGERELTPGQKQALLRRIAQLVTPGL